MKKPITVVVSILGTWAALSLCYAPLAAADVSSQAPGDRAQVVNFFATPNGIQITDLGVPPGFENPFEYSQALAINRSGDVVGDFGVINGRGSRSFFWQRSTGMVEIPAPARNFASDINDARVITLNTFDVLPRQAFAFFSGSFIGLPSPFGVPNGIVANAINNSNQIVGSSAPDLVTRAATLWSPRGTVLLGNLGGGSSSANDINDNGVVVGSSRTANGQTHPFVWSNGQIRDLGTLSGSTDCEATSINNQNAIVGWCSLGLEFIGFRFANGVLAPLARSGPASQDMPASINDEGFVVGTNGFFFPANPNDSPSRPIAWAPDGTVIDLNQLLPPGSNWTLKQATDINGSFQVVGTGIHSGETHAFVLGPRF